MEEIAGWVAPIATMIAAMMTAANLGPRFTGWGFVIFTVGSIAWSIVAIVTGQANLLWTNGFLTIVNLVGIWRWLGREAKFDDGAKAAQAKSERPVVATLFPIASIIGTPLTGNDGTVIGHGVGAMAACADGRIAYVVVREGGVVGVGERLHALAWDDMQMRDGGLVAPLDAKALAALPEVDPKEWPIEAPEAVAA